MTDARSIAYVRTEDAPHPAAAGGHGGRPWAGCARTCFSSLRQCAPDRWHRALLWPSIAWTILDWAIIRAVWIGCRPRGLRQSQEQGPAGPSCGRSSRNGCYGFYPISERWRPSLLFVIAVVALMPMLMPSAPYKQWNALFLLVVLSRSSA